VTDFTYVPVYSGFVYVALVIDLYSRAIVGWETSTIKDTALSNTACGWPCGGASTPAARCRRD